MDQNSFTLIMSFVTIFSTIVGVWALNKRNDSTIKKEQALSEVRAQDADIKERSDLLDMLKEGTKQGAIWLESLKVIEKTREADYATLKAIIEDGTKETINSRKELLKEVKGLGEQATTHNTGVTNGLEEVKKEVGHIKAEIDKLPGKHDEIVKRLDATLGYIDRILPKLRSTTEMQAVNGGSGEQTSPLPSPS